MTEDEELELLQLEKEKSFSQRRPQAEPFTAGKIIPEAISNVESVARGGIAATAAGTPALAGIPGSIESLGRAGLRKLGAKVSEETVLPTMSEIYEPISQKVKQTIPRVTKPTTEAAGFETIGEFAGTPLSPRTIMSSAGKVKTAAEAMRTGMGGVRDVLRAPKPVGDPSGFVAIGEKLEGKVKGEASKLLSAKQTEANTLYENAKETARIMQAQGQPFARSEFGNSLLNALEGQKRILAGGQEFEVGQDKINAINRLINAIKGTTTGGELRPVGKGQVSSKIQVKTPTKTTEKDVDAIVEELRYLREVNRPGNEFTGYGALDANYRRDLINVLQKALYDWSDEYRIADEAYKASSKTLAPFQTRLMEKLMKKEKYDRSELATDTEKFADEFFNSRDSVANLKVAIKDDKFVKDIAKDYVATLFSNKTPQQVKAYASDPRNSGWMTEAGILNDVQKYANTATKVENRKDILKKLAIGSAAIAVGTRVGSMLGQL
jgi:hypothetical protein